MFLLNKEFKDTGLCVASREYQYLKLKELDSKELPVKEHDKEFNKITVKSCTCVGLGTSALIAHDIETKSEGSGVSVCPGPNMAYFSKEISLNEMTDHIYGASNVISRTDRPNMFTKELSIYIDYLKVQFEDSKDDITTKKKKYLQKFTKNLNEGISYYQDLFSNLNAEFQDTKSAVLNDLNSNNKALALLSIEIDNL